MNWGGIKPMHGRFMGWTFRVDGNRYPVVRTKAWRIPNEDGVYRMPPDALRSSISDMLVAFGDVWGNGSMEDDQ